MSSYTVMQFVDALMVGQLGPLELAAQGNGGVWTFAFIAFVFGLLALVNTFTAQHLGAGTEKKAAAYAWGGIWLSIAVWVVVMLPAALVLPLLFGAMGHSPELVQEESAYGSILLLGAVFLLSGKSLHHFFFGLHRPKVITVTAIIANIVNLFSTYALTFGSEGLPSHGLPGIPGMPALGVRGAAIGTCIGTFIELLIPLAVFLSPAMNRALATRAAWRPNRRAILDLVRVGWPSALQTGNELLCWSLLVSVFVGRFGLEHMTAGWAALRYMHLSFMPAVGFSIATTALVGRYIGAGQPDVAAARVRLALGITMAYMLACGIVFFVFREALIGVFVPGNVEDPEMAARIIKIGSMVLIAAAIFQVFDAVGIIYSGALRGAGDTVWPGVVTVVYSWFFMVFGAWAMTELFPQLESLGPWIGATAFLITLGVTMFIRFERGAWRSISLLAGRE